MIYRNCQISNSQRSSADKKNGADGFSLIEVMIAFAVFLIAMLGVFSAFTFCVNYNAGNYSRAQALTILQRESERLRSARFTPYITDDALTGGVKPSKTIIGADGKRYIVQTTVDDDPTMAGVQTDLSKKFKEITVTVSPEIPVSAWQTAVPTATTLQRTRAN